MVREKDEARVWWSKECRVWDESLDASESMQDVKAKESIEHELLKGVRRICKTLELVQLGLQCLDLGEERVLAHLDTCVVSVTEKLGT